MPEGCKMSERQETAFLFVSVCVNTLTEAMESNGVVLFAFVVSSQLMRKMQTQHSAVRSNHTVASEEF